MEQRRSRLLKVLIPVLIVIAIGAMWFIKNGSSSSATLETADLGSDFSLNATEEIDSKPLQNTVCLSLSTTELIPVSPVSRWLPFSKR